MREILFKGISVDSGEWVEGYYCPTAFVRFPCKPLIYPITEINSCWHAVEVIPETVNQFTGLYDSTKWESLSELEQQKWLKNHTKDEWKGRRIFEGDILKYGDRDICEDNIYEVEFEHRDGAAYFGLKYSSTETVAFDTYIDLSQVVVVGNIYDNPELRIIGK